jgi:hypothetical protein
VGGGVVLWRSGIPNSLMVRFAISRCAAYSAAPEHVVYLEYNGKGPIPASESPASLTLSDRTNTRRFARVPECLGRWGMNNEPLRQAPLFLGKLKAQDGAEQTVYVAMSITRPFPDQPYQRVYTREYCAHVGTWQVKGSGVNRDGLWTSGGDSVMQVFSLKDDPRIDPHFENNARVYRFFAGQRDVSDASHFTVDFDADDQRVRIHGYLISKGKLLLSLECIRGPKSAVP